jgi:hypothetical protein
VCAASPPEPRAKSESLSKPESRRQWTTPPSVVHGGECLPASAPLRPKTTYIHACSIHLLDAWCKTALLQVARYKKLLHKATFTFSVVNTLAIAIFTGGHPWLMPYLCVPPPVRNARALRAAPLGGSPARTSGKTATRGIRHATGRTDKKARPCEPARLTRLSTRLTNANLGRTLAKLWPHGMTMQLGIHRAAWDAV